LDRISAPPPGNKRRALMALALLIAIGYLGLGFAIDATLLRHATAELGWLGCGFVLGLSLLNYLLRFSRWHLFIARLGHRLPVARHLLYYLSGFALTVSPAKAGEALRGIYLREHGVGYSQSVGALFVERLLDLLAMIVLASLVVSRLPAYRPLVLGVLAIALAMVGCASSREVREWIESHRDRVRGPRTIRALAALSNLLRSAALLLQPRVVIYGTAIGVVSWGCEGVGLYLICQSMHMSVGLMPAVSIYAIAVLAGSAAFFLPAGIGGTEVAMTAMLIGTGAPLHDALIATLLCRVATLWFAVLIGIAAAAAVELSAPLHRLRPAPR
jgi:uncharacterized protein (TIRG00374 family)